MTMTSSHASHHWLLDRQNEASDIATYMPQIRSKFGGLLEPGIRLFVQAMIRKSTSHAIMPLALVDFVSQCLSRLQALGQIIPCLRIGAVLWNTMPESTYPGFHIRYAFFQRPEPAIVRLHMPLQPKKHVHMVRLLQQLTISHHSSLID